MNDFISRQAAIEALNNEYMAVGILGEQWAISQCIDAIKKLPTIDPVKHGKWIIDSGACEPDYMECSCCIWITEYYSGLEEEWDYCPHCGAKMERSE